VRIITYSFGGLIGGLTGILLCLVGIVVTCAKDKESTSGVLGEFMAGGFFVSVFTPITMAGITAAFYSDWILAAIAGDGWAGTPSDDNAIFYYTYFAAKRLPMLSW
jgi:hypothetical protein